MRYAKLNTVEARNTSVAIVERGKITPASIEAKLRAKTTISTSVSNKITMIRRKLQGVVMATSTSARDLTKSKTRSTTDKFTRSMLSNTMHENPISSACVALAIRLIKAIPSINSSTNAEIASVPRRNVARAHVQTGIMNGTTVSIST